MLAGIGFLVTMYFTVKMVATDKKIHLLSFALSMSLPSSLLFFGYVETYAVVLFSISLYILTGILYLRQRIPFALVAACFVFQCLTHYLTVLTGPSLIYLAYEGFRKGDRKDVILGVTVLICVIISIFIGIGGDLRGFYSAMPHQHYLPLFPSENPAEQYSTAYTILSWKHAVDILNLSILLFPASLYLYFAKQRKLVDTQSAAQGKYFLYGLIPIMLFAMIAKFDPGTARDWDVLAPYAYPAVLLGVSTFISRQRSENGKMILLLLTGITIANSFLFFSVNASVKRSLERFESLLDRNMISQGAVYSGILYLASYYNEKGDRNTPTSLWDKYVNDYPEDVRGYFNVIKTIEYGGGKELLGPVNY